MQKNKNFSYMSSNPALNKSSKSMPKPYPAAPLRGVLGVLTIVVRKTSLLDVSQDNDVTKEDCPSSKILDLGLLKNNSQHHWQVSM